MREAFVVCIKKRHQQETNTDPSAPPERLAASQAQLVRHEGLPVAPKLFDEFWSLVLALAVMAQSGFLATNTRSSTLKICSDFLLMHLGVRMRASHPPCASVSILLLHHRAVSRTWGLVNMG